MRDAVELAAALAKQADWAGAVTACEARMFERVAEVAERSAEGAAIQMSHIGEALSLEHLRQHRASAAA
jgi:hypothetical protein